MDLFTTISVRLLVAGFGLAAVAMLLSAVRYWLLSRKAAVGEARCGRCKFLILPHAATQCSECGSDMWNEGVLARKCVRPPGLSVWIPACVAFSLGCAIAISEVVPFGWRFAVVRAERMVEQDAADPRQAYVVALRADGEGKFFGRSISSIRVDAYSEPEGPVSHDTLPAPGLRIDLASMTCVRVHEGQQPIGEPRPLSITELDRWLRERAWDGYIRAKLLVWLEPQLQQWPQQALAAAEGGGGDAEVEYYLPDRARIIAIAVIWPVFLAIVMILAWRMTSESRERYLKRSRNLCRSLGLRTILPAAGRAQDSSEPRGDPPPSDTQEEKQGTV